MLARSLAACGGGGGSTALTPATPITTEPETPPADLTALFAAAQDASDDAVTAGDAAAAALKAATDSAEKLTTMEVAGDSMTAYTSADNILKSNEAAAQAVTDAQAALDAANMAMTDAAGIDADHPQKASLDAAIADAIEVADAQLKDATAVRDGDALEDAVEEVTGGEDADTQGTPKSVAEAVATDIGMALLPTTEMDGGGTRVMDLTEDAPAMGDAAIIGAVRMDDHQGKTWAQIVGEDNVKDMRKRQGHADRYQQRRYQPR